MADIRAFLFFLMTTQSACHESGIPLLSMLEFIDQKINAMNSTDKPSYLL